MMTTYFASHLGFHLWPALLSIAILEGITVSSWQFRKDASARFLMYIQIGQLIWLLSMLLAQQSRPVAERIFWIGFLQIESIFTCTLWYQFVLTISGYRSRMPRWPLYLMWAVIVIFAALILTNPWHHAYWAPIMGSPEEQQMHFGWAANLETVAAYLILAITMGVAFCWYRGMTGMNRRLAWLSMWGGAACWIGHVLTLFPVMSFLAPQPLSFSLSGIIIVWAYQRWRPFNIIPLAQQRAVEIMVDGVLVVDDASYIVAMNPMLQTILHGLSIHVGIRYEALLAAWPELQSMSASTEIEAIRTVHGKPMCFKVTRTPLQTPAGKDLGRMVLFTDITLENARRAQILDQREASARLAERATLGRELHDGAGQIWSFVSMQLETARQQLALRQNEPARRTLERTLEAVNATHLNLRESITGLQARLSGAEGLQHSIREQIRWYQQQCDLEIELRVDPSWPEKALTPTAKVQLLRIFQETMTNIRKHAQARHVLILLCSEARMLEIRIKDDGCGFNREQMQGQRGHHGIAIMQERARQIHARLKFDSAPQSGTTVSIDVPIQSSMNEEMR